VPVFPVPFSAYCIKTNIGIIDLIKNEVTYVFGGQMKIQGFSELVYSGPDLFYYGLKSSQFLTSHRNCEWVNDQLLVCTIRRSLDIVYGPYVPFLCPIWLDIPNKSFDFHDFVVLLQEPVKWCVFTKLRAYQHDGRSRIQVGFSTSNNESDEDLKMSTKQ
jgi:hypothetical protein